MEVYGKIYRITNKFNGKIYIGQTTRTVEERFAEHARCQETYIGKAIRKYGEENFLREIIEECDTREQLNEREIFWIATLNCKRPNGYNLTDGGEGVVGFKCTPETRAKMSASHKGLPKSPETRVKLATAHKGKKCTPEMRAKLSAANSGENNPHYGKHHTPETRAKMSVAQTGHKVSAETAVKIAVANTGKHPTNETRAKMSVAHSGEKNHNFGKPMLAEQKIKLSVANRKKSPFKNLLVEMDKRQLLYTQLAKLLNLSIPTISEKMRGKKNFTKEQIAKLEEIFGLSAEYLMVQS